MAGPAEARAVATEYFVANARAVRVRAQSFCSHTGYLIADNEREREGFSLSFVFDTLGA